MENKKIIDFITWLGNGNVDRGMRIFRAYQGGSTLEEAARDFAYPESTTQIPAAVVYSDWKRPLSSLDKTVLSTLYY